MALHQIDHLLDQEVPRARVVIDAFYGRATDLRDEIAKRGLHYVAAVREDTTVPAGWFGRGPLSAIGFGEMKIFRRRFVSPPDLSLPVNRL